MNSQFFSLPVADSFTAYGCVADPTDWQEVRDLIAQAGFNPDAVMVCDAVKPKGWQLPPWRAYPDEWDRADNALAAKAPQDAARCRSGCCVCSQM